MLFLRDDVEFGRMEICAPGKHPNTGLVTVHDHHYECRVHFTGRVTYVHARQGILGHVRGGNRNCMQPSTRRPERS